MRTTVEYNTLWDGPDRRERLVLLPAQRSTANPRRQEAQDKQDLASSTSLQDPHPTVPSRVRAQGSASGAMMAVCALLYPAAAYEASPSSCPPPSSYAKRLLILRTLELF